MSLLRRVASLASRTAISCISLPKTAALRPEGPSICRSWPSHLFRKWINTESLEPATSSVTLGKLRDVEVKLTNFRGEDRGFAILGGDVFDVPVRKDIVHRVVRWQLAKRRQGTHCTKGVHEVSGSGRKPWNQKGSGRARAGSLRAPQFRGGATMHGPKPRSHEHGLQKKVRRLGLKVALSARVAEGKLLLFEDLKPQSEKTKVMANFLNTFPSSRKFLFVDGDTVEPALTRAIGNIHYANVLPQIGLNVYSILQHDTLVMSLDAARKIEQRLRAPINRGRPFVQPIRT